MLKLFGNTHKWPHFELLEHCTVLYWLYNLKHALVSASPRQYPEKQAKQHICLLWGKGQVRRNVPYFLHSSQKAGLQLSSAIWVGKYTYISVVKTRCLQSYRFCKLPSMRFCDVCMYYCDAVTIMKAWITKWASCTHTEVLEKRLGILRRKVCTPNWQQG